MNAQESGSIAASVLFGIAFFIALANLRRTKFRIYGALGASSLFRCIGFAFRASYYDPNGAHIRNYQPVYFAFTQAGFGISLAVIALMMGTWFKNASQDVKPKVPAPMKLSVAVRLCMFPIIVFGPISGIAIAVLIYGNPTIHNVSTGLTLRTAATWGLMGVSILLFIFVFVASTTAYLARRNPKASYENLDMLVFLTLLCMALDAMAAGSRVADLYHPQVFLNPNLFFPLVVLPEMLEIIIMSVPFLLARMALGAGYSRHMELAFPPNGPTVDLEGFKQ